MSGCEPSSSAPSLLVLAAASLGDVLPPLAASFEAEHGVAVRLSFASSATLHHQIERGATADVFVSAADDPLDSLELARRLAPGSRREVARNEIVAVTRSGHALPEDLRDLASQRGRIGLGDAGVPVGEYARASLRELGLWEIIQDRVVPLAHEQAVLQAVMRGAVDWGIVYRSSARERVDVIAALPATTHPPVRYSAAALSASSHPALARAFLDHLTSPAGRERFADAGFLPPETD